MTWSPTSRSTGRRSRRCEAKPCPGRRSSGPGTARPIRAPPSSGEKQAEFDALLAQLDSGLGGDQFATVEERLAQLEPEVLALTEAVESRETWDLEAPEDQWQHDVLEELVRRLEELDATQLSEATKAQPFGWSVVKRLEFARWLEQSSAEGGDHALAWSKALPEIREAYPDLDLQPQVGLVPLGSDPDSGLWEFAHLMTGEAPSRDEQRRLVLTEETGVVLVLLPTGTFWMGAQASDPGGRNYDPDARLDQGPVHEVELSAHFLSKYEMTQGQWKRVTGRNPSLFGPDGYWAENWLVDRARPSLLHPVENVSWTDCMEWLVRSGLALPSEAQWEHGARGGTQTLYWSGSDLASLAGAANISDAYAKSHGSESWTVWEPDFDDGSSVHWPVGTSLANPFGLHDVHGNLWEWTRDGFDPFFYAQSPRTDPVAPWDSAAYRPARGGSFFYSAMDARCTFRANFTPLNAGNSVGVRPARAVDS